MWPDVVYRYLQTFTDTEKLKVAQEIPPPAMEMDIEVNISSGSPTWERPAALNGSQSSNNETTFTILLAPLAMSVPEAIGTAISLSAIMIGTVVGNVLVILSVFTYKPLRSVQNMFIVSLAVADIAVAVCVMPFNVAYSIIGRWVFGLRTCEMWLTCDVLCCTASILNLCAIALDRYWAIHDPINYAQKRTLKRVLYMIFLVWTISGLISVPPLIGWNDWPETFTEATPCKLTEEKGYVIYSSSGSFYIPLVIMTTVYLKIFHATRKRLRERARASAQIANLKDNKKNSDIPMKNLSAEGSPVVTAGDASCVSTEGTPRSSPTERRNNSPALMTSQDEGRNGQPSLTVRQYMEQKQRISLSRERRAARILGIVMGVFVLCWLPFFLMYVIVPFCDACYVSERMVNFITWLGYVNSALNPVIYTIFNKDFREAFRRLLCNKR